MNILVTGAAGQLGRSIKAVLDHRENYGQWRMGRKFPSGGNDNYFFTDICSGYVQLDITDKEAVNLFVQENKIECIINCAAWTNVDAAEDAQDKVFSLNSLAPSILSEIMKSAGGLLIHLSTDYVFGKEVYNTPCTEEMSGTPSGVYGFSKQEGERAIEKSGGDYVIIRTSWLYSEFGSNFCKSIIKLISEKESIKVVEDQTGTPTYALDLSEAILSIIEDYKKEMSIEPEGEKEDTTSSKGNLRRNQKSSQYSKRGIYNFSCEGVCSWYDFAKHIAAYCGNTQCDITPCLSKDYPTKVVRPPYSVLDKTKIKRIFGLKIPYWTESLKECIEHIRVQEKVEKAQKDIDYYEFLRIKFGLSPRDFEPQ